MHATKVGWVGQTFALAKSNDSGGRKSRIRRSKEERKEMVESFIKRYQQSNNGSFPSLNLTHKEVGGSFYTVRELVRDVIQENRVLGPPKMLPGEQIMDNFLEQYPLGSVSVDPYTNVEPSHGTQILLDHHQYTIEDQVLHSQEPHHGRRDKEKIVNGIAHAALRNEEFKEVIDTELLIKRDAESEKFEEKEPEKYQGKYTSEEQVLNSRQIPEIHHEKHDNEKLINSSTHTAVRNEEVEEPLSAELLVKRGEEGEKEVETYQASISQISDVVVETFPLRSFSNRIFDLDGKLSESEVLVRALEEKDIGSMVPEAGTNNSSELDNMHFLKISSEMVDTEAKADLTLPVPETKCILVDGKGQLKSKSQNSSTTNESMAFDTNDGADNKDTLPAGNKPADVLNGFHAENLNRNNTNSSVQQSTLKEASADKGVPRFQHVGGSKKKGSDPMLNKINLESWEEATSKKSAGPETNSLVAFIRAFITAFVKFWSD